MRRISFIAAAILLASQAHAAQMTQWDGLQNGSPKTYALGGYKLTLTSKLNGDQMAMPNLAVTAPDMPPIALEGQAAGDVARASFGVVKLAPKQQPSVIFTSYSGGAHCCVEILVLQPVAGAWKKVDLGSWDGDGAELPKDADGDGIADFVMIDNAFLYAFDSYAASWAPPLVMNVVNGKAQNVSAAKRYAALYRADMEKARSECAKHQNGACAAFVADAARIGQYDEAWKFMLANYDKASSWTYPTRCDGKMVESQCKGREIKPADYPQSLQWFLQDNGYIKK
ncbi:MAG TPA: hypothetical protein VGM36_16515 [Rhizomicrobium sp.]|jgi:hypothetical protein